MSMSVLRGIWNDMVEKRLWPVAVVLLVAAVALPVVLSRSSASTVVPQASAPSADTPQVAVTPAPANPNQQVAETVDGARFQRTGSARDPFVHVKPAVTTTSVSRALTPVASAVGASVHAVSTATKTTSTAVAAPTTPPAAVPTHITPTPAVHPVPLYHVAAAFGPMGAIGKSFTLIQRLAAMPSNKNGLVAYMGVTGNGKEATFALLHAALPTGPGTCRPSPTQCELITLKIGQTETLEFLDGASAGQVDSLSVVAIVKRSGSSATVATASARGQISAQGRALLRQFAARVLGALRYHAATGVVTFSLPTGG
jgi:hypothetical protein